jgi:small GTP-binding protein
LEKNLSPVAVTPVTAIVTLFDYNKKTGATVSFLDNRSENISIDTIHQYITEEENPENEKQVKYVKIEDDIELLQSVSIVDTPGLGSVFEHNTTTTINFIPKIDAAVYVLSADIPVSKADREFLQELSNKVPKILFVLNKADLLDEHDLSKMLSHNAKAISNIMAASIAPENILPVSGKYADKAASNIDVLRNNIIHIAKHEKANLLEKSSLKRMEWVLKQVMMEMQLKLESLLMPLHELEDKQRKVAHSVHLMKEQKNEFGHIIAGKINTVQEEIHQSVSAESNAVRKEIEKRIHEKYIEGDFLLNDEKVLQLQNELNRLLVGRFENIRRILENNTREQFKSILQHYSNRSESFFHELSSNLSSLMGIGFDVIAEKFDLNAYTSFYISLDSGLNPLSTQRSAFNWLLSKKKLKRKLMGNLLEHYNNISIRNSASIGYDLQYKIQESFRKFNYDLNAHLTELLNSLQKIIDDTVTLRVNKKEFIDEEVKGLRQAIGQILAMEHEIKKFHQFKMAS